MGIPNDPRQHHFVAAGYLMPWTSGRRRTLYAFDVGRGLWLPNQKPNRLAKEGDFYRVDAPGLEPFAVEVEVLAAFETKALPVIADIIAGRFPIADERLALVIAFVALAYVRTQGQRDRVQARADRMLRKMSAIRWPDRESFERHRDAAVAGGVNVGQLTFERFRAMMDSQEVTMGVDQTALIGTMLLAWRKLSLDFGARTWTLWRRSPRAPMFVTSDQPVGLFRGVSGGERAWTGEAPFRADPRAHDIVVTMPLSPDLMLVGDFLPPHGEIIIASSEDVAMFNLCTVLPGLRWVYACSRDLRWLDPADGAVKGAEALHDSSAVLSDDAELVEQEADAWAERLAQSADITGDPPADPV